MAGAFHAASLALGIPSSIAFVFLAWESARLRFMTPDVAGTGTSGDQLIDLLAAGFRLFGKMLALFAGAVHWVIVVLAVGSMLCIALAVVLFFTARGLHAGRHWARILGIFVAILPLLLSFAAISALQRPVPLIVSTMIAAASVYVIWTLGFRFN